MALETATYVSDLVPANPPAADPMAQGANHIRLIKSALQATLPNVVGAVTATTAALNSAGAAFANAGTLTVPANGTTAGAAIILDGTATNLTLSNVGGVLEVLSNTGTNLAQVDQSGNFNASGGVNGAAITQGGVALVPRGIIVMWSGATTAVPAGWNLCDGTNGTPDMRGLFVAGAGSASPYPAAFSTGGSNLFGGATSTAGAHTHGAATGAAGAHAHGGLTEQQGAHQHTGSDGAHALTIAEMPYHDHGIAGITLIGSSGNLTLSGSGTFGAVGFSPQGGSQAHSHAISIDGAHAHALTTDTAADHAHSISSDGLHSHTVVVEGLPPYIALGFIMKL